MSDKFPVILAPLIALLSSKEFILMVVTALVDAVVAAIPDLRPMRDQFITLFTGLAALIVVKFGVDDTVASNNAAKVQIAQTAANASIQAEQLHLESVRVQAAANKAP